MQTAQSAPPVINSVSRKQLSVIILCMKELLAMKYALAKFRVYLLIDRPLIVYTDHASSRTAVNSPHLLQRMARSLSFFAEYNFSVEYKSGQIDVVADALSRRPDFESAAQSKSEIDTTGATLVISVPSSRLLDDIKRPTQVIRLFCD